MTVKPLNPPPFKTRLTDANGNLNNQWSWWFGQVSDRLGGGVDKVEAAASTAAAAVPRSTEVVAGGGLQIGGALDGNIAIALYRAVDVVAALPSTGLSEGDWAFALNGRKSGETAGNGTGCPVWWSAPAGVGGWYTGAGALVTV